MSFQDRVNQDVPSGFAGDFATSNPRIVLGGGNIVFRAGKGGVLASSFVWRDTNSNFVINGEPAEFGKNRTLRFSGHP